MNLKIISFNSIGTKRGDFCYGLDGTVGTVDDYMTDVPINVDCDPRASCSQSTARSRCEREFPSMLKIIVSVILKKLTLAGRKSMAVYLFDKKSQYQVSTKVPLSFFHAC